MDKMLEEGLIEHSISAWSVPTVLVTKKDGSTRFCVDYRHLNARTKKDAFPLSRIDDLLNSLSGQAWFSTLDLASGYWQVRLSENAKPKTAFTTHSGLFQFAVMPFGLCNAPATLEALSSLYRRHLLDVSVISAKGHKYILVVCDYFTRYIEAYPLADKTARSVADALMDKWLPTYGFPLFLHSDQGKEFDNAMVHKLSELLGTVKTKTTPYHPRSDGLVEHFNRTRNVLL